VSPSSSDPQKFGHRPEEQVFGGTVRRPPSTRVRIASPPMQGSLSFEAEIGSQAEEIRAALASTPAPAPGLAFEPEEGQPLELVAPRPGAATGPGESPQDAIDELVKLAAAPEPPPPPREPPPSQPHVDVAGDLEAELLIPHASKTPGGTSTPSTGVLPTVESDPGHTRPLGDADPNEETSTGRSRSWISVFLSDQVAGKKKKKRRSTIFRRQTAIVGSAASRAFGAIVKGVRGAARSIDAVTSRYRLPLDNIIWSALIALLTVALGVGWALAGVFLAICLILTVAGQSARNLLGYSGIIICSAAIAEMIRQRERFLEILLDLF